MTERDATLPTVFIGCAVEDINVANEVQARLDRFAEAEIWHENAFVPTRAAFESLMKTARRVDFAVLIANAWDTVAVRRNLNLATPDSIALVPRDNVIFEFGLFLGALGRDRVFLLVDRAAASRLPTDLSGVVPLDYDGGKQNVRSAVGPAGTEIERAIKTFGHRGRADD